MNVAAPAQCWPLFLRVVLEHHDLKERLERVLEADSPENEVQRFLGVFFEGFGQFIIEKRARRGASIKGQLKETIQLFGDSLFSEYMRSYLG